MNNLRKIRGRLGLTQLELAKKLKMSRTTITGMEKYITVEKAKKCSETLGVDLIEILGTDILKIQPKSKEELEHVIKVLEESRNVLE